MPVLKTVTLGCKVNQYETEYVRQGLLGAGYREARGDESADLCLVNTCTVTRQSDYKSRKIIRALARANPGAEIIVMGCYATRAPEEVASLPGVVEVVTDKRRLPELLARFGATEVLKGISAFGRLHRAYVKVQDGCRMRCSYCVIPRVRPVLASRPAGEVLDEVRRLVDCGHLEIVLTGIHLGHYGVDLAGRRPDGRPIDLAFLVRQILALDGRWRLRLSSLEAGEITPELIALMAAHADRICPHLHVPMQSGSEAVLARMGRHAGLRRLLRQCEHVRRALDAPALTTDLIVGFPGETEDDFRATCRVVREVGFARVHVFRFSAREGTPAATMADQVPDSVKKRRAAELAEIGRESQRDYLQSLVGRRLEVLVESRMNEGTGMLLGTAERYVAVELPDGEGRIDHLIWAIASEVVGDRIRAGDIPPPHCDGNSG
jgi:threonylcarbamoyladenosine tRNA methylthiotransferase MtaB